MSLDLEASRFLNNFLRVREQVEKQANAPVLEDVIEHVSTMEVENVILSRVKEPRFFGGTVGKGDNQRAVWVPRMEQARPVSGDRVHLYEERLGEELLPLYPYAR